MQSFTQYLTTDTACVAVLDEQTQTVVTLRLFRGPGQGGKKPRVFVSRRPANKPLAEAKEMEVKFHAKAT